MFNDEYIIDSQRHERLDVGPRGLSRLYIGCDKDPCNGAGVSSFNLGEAAAVSQPREGSTTQRCGPRTKDGATTSAATKNLTVKVSSAPALSLRNANQML